MPSPNTDRSVLEAALVGFTHQLGQITLKITEIQRILGKGQPGGAATEAQPKRKHMSTSARARIAAAQRKRWAALKEQKATPVKPGPKKRHMSVEARKRIAKAARKRWADIRAKKAKA